MDLRNSWLVLNSSALVLLGICHLPELVYSCVANHPESLEKDFSLGDVRGEPGWLKPTSVSLQCSIIILHWLFGSCGCSDCRSPACFILLTESCCLTSAVGVYAVLCPATGSAARSLLTMQICIWITNK